MGASIPAKMITCKIFLNFNLWGAVMIFGLYHSPGETIGLMHNILKDLHLPFKDVHLHDNEGLPRDISDLEGLIVMGGPMNVDEVTEYPFLLPELQLIEKVLKEGKPILGICLGAQLMAKALGKKIYKNKVREVGWHPIQLTPQAKQDPLFKNMPTELDVLHWHGDTFDIPEGAVPLAKSKNCPNQAFRWGKTAYALQFHLEVTPAMLKKWCDAKCEESFIRSAGEDPQKIISTTTKAFEVLEPLAREFFTSYFKMSYSHLLASV
ncbi:MAG: Carbamoyl-phosphate synthase small chain [Elusimicrobia bacterium]|nr:Carbamoyl-phosphate synthase small chain [Elusimicrobiota bacterium]